MKIGWNSPVGDSLGRSRYVTQRVGLELEYEFCTKPFDCPDKWTTTHDYSLRKGGMEFVSRPLLEKEIDTAVMNMLAAARQGGGEDTLRCGTHVHVNCTFMTWRELYQFVTLYTLLEPYLFKKYADGREISHFCVPTWTNTALVEYMYKDSQMLRNGLMISGASGPHDWKRAAYIMTGGHRANGRSPLTMLNTPKYGALNLNSLKKFGTLEFRQAPSSLKAEFISGWAKQLLRIQREAMTYDSPEQIVATYELQGHLTLCESVGLTPKGTPDDLDIEDAVDAATIMAGHVPVSWQSLEWEL